MADGAPARRASCRIFSCRWVNCVSCVCGFVYSSCVKCTVCPFLLGSVNDGFFFLLWSAVRAELSIEVNTAVSQRWGGGFNGPHRKVQSLPADSGTSEGPAIPCRPHSSVSAAASSMVAFLTDLGTTNHAAETPQEQLFQCRVECCLMRSPGSGGGGCLSVVLCFVQPKLYLCFLDGTFVGFYCNPEPIHISTSIFNLDLFFCAFVTCNSKIDLLKGVRKKKRILRTLLSKPIEPQRNSSTLLSAPDRQLNA